MAPGGVACECRFLESFRTNARRNLPPNMQGQSRRQCSRSGASKASAWFVPYPNDAARHTRVARLSWSR
eukprot:scaffold8266_cov175-Amphora_coffeaeformis.AAC.2